MAENIIDASNVSQSGLDPVRDEGRKSRGCFFWGCLGSIGVAVLLAVFAGIGYYKLMGYVKSFTAEEPAQIQTYEPSAGEYEAIQAKIQKFKSAVDSGTSGVELVLSGDDINAFIASDPDMAELVEKVYVKIERDSISADVSIPLDEVPGFEGRYLNGSAGVTVSMEPGIFEVKLTSLEVNGNPVPDEFMEAFSQENLAKDVDNNPEMAELIKKVQDIRIENDKLVLVSR